MKPDRIIGRLMMGCVLACCLTSKTVAQSAADYAVVENGANYRILQKTAVENGTNRIHRYTELSTGLNFRDPTTGQWTEAQQQVSIQPQGGAAAVQGQHQVYFPPDIGSGVLKVVTPDGRVLQSRPLGVTYDDGKNTVFIGVLTNSAGWLTASNQVTYRDCFTGIHADLVCTYRRGGFECDLVFRSRPDDPSIYGLSDADSTVQLITEFFNTANPQQIPDASDDWFGLQDDTLNFGRMTMGQGRAFAAGSFNSHPSTPNSSTPVYKSWLHLGGRTFLVEQVPLLYLADDLDALPLTSRIEQPGTGKLLAATRHGVGSKFASNTPEFPPALPMATDTNQILIASAGLNRQPGVVLDYNVVDMDQGDFTFASGQTYFISGGVNIGGTATFEAGTILKFPEDGSDGLYCGAVVCATTAYNPAVFTSQNDDSVGLQVEGSSGSPATGGNSYIATGSELTNFQFYYAGIAVTTPASCPQEVFDNLQFYNCTWGIAWGGDVTLINGLASGCWMVGDGGDIFKNVTFDNCFAADDACSEFYNCIFSSMGNIIYDYWGFDDGEAPYNSYNNGFDNSDQEFGANPQTGSGYQTGPLGNFYLPASSPFIDAGNTTADMLGLYWWTTQTTQDIEGITPVDLGYHYPAVDANGNPVDSDGDGIPDYLEDQNGNGLPDTWEMQYFGNLNQSASTLDTVGNTLLYDYQNDIDLSGTVSFTVRLGNQDFNTTSGTGNYVVISGVPYHEAVLVNDTNLNDAVWNNYDGNIYLNLGPTDGVYQVWFGLKGLGANAQATWFGTDVTLNRSKPKIFITSPVTNVVATPYIQLQGFSALPLVGVTFDVSNALAVVTNQRGNITGHFINTNTSSYTTDYFQCYDIPLTNGLNAITLHCTDPAGNVTTSNLNITLDYSTASNPVINLAWPQNGMQICGSTFTLRGWTEDASATVTVQITDTNLDTNVVSGIVERTGMLWVNNLPLAEGANVVTLWVTNAAGLSSETNITVVKSDMTLTLTSVDGDLWLPTVNVKGNISDTTAAIWVNGVEGNNNGDGTWNAANVPVTAGGVASFDINAAPAGGGDPDANDTLNKQNEEMVDSGVWSSDGSSPSDSGPDQVTGNYKFDVGGGVTDDCPGGDTEEWVLSPGGAVKAYYINGVDHTTGYGQIPGPPGYGLEKGGLHAPQEDGDTYQDRHTIVKMSYYAGGPGVAGKQLLMAVSASAVQELAIPHFLWIGPDIPSEQITIPALGKLGADGWVYGVVANGSKVDVTPTVTGVPMYYWPMWPNVGTFALSIWANNNDLSTTTPTFCVGQNVGFVPVWNSDPQSSGPPNQADAETLWNLPAKYVNEQWQEKNDNTGLPLPNCSMNYCIDSSLLDRILSRDGKLSTSCWYVNGNGGGCGVLMDLHFSNGQSASLMSVGKFIVYRPSVNQPVPYPPFAAIPSDDLLHLNDGSMWFDVSITSNYPGSFGIVQLVNYFAQNGVTFNTSFGSFWLDGSGYYEGPKDRSVKCTLFDGPGIYLGLVTASYDGHWKDYVCFTPPGGIPVTLGRIEWNWSASALNPDPLIGWIIESDHVDGPTLYPDDSFPFWSNVKPSSE